MITGHVFIATSLDGFIARPDGDIKWLLDRDDPLENHGYENFISDIDVIVMGRGTYEKVSTLDEWYYTQPVVVLSKTLKESDLPDKLKEKVTISSLTPKELMKQLDEKGWQRIYVDGGQVIQSFLRDNLIEDIIITKIPILIGQGRPLFGSLKKDVSLDHLKTISFPSGLVQSHYRIWKK